MENAGQFMTTTRAALHGALLEAARDAGVEIATRSAVAGADPAGALLLADGSRLSADLVIAADGVRSAVAQQAGLTLQRTQHPDGVTRVLLDREGLRGPEWDWVHDMYDYRRRPLRLLYSPCGSDAFYVCLMAPAADARASEIPVPAQLWADSFPAFAPVLRRIGPLGRHDRYTSLRLPAWSRGRVAVAGDAGHAMPSSLGQGAGVSMLNAVRLAQAANAASDVTTGLATWERTMRPIVEQWQSRAEEVATQRALATTIHPGEDLLAERPEALPLRSLQAGPET